MKRLLFPFVFVVACIGAGICWAVFFAAALTYEPRAND